MKNLVHDNIWISKPIYEEAESKFYENKSKASLTPLAGEVAKARQRLIESRDTFNEGASNHSGSGDAGAVQFFEKKTFEFEKSISQILEKIKTLELRVSEMEKKANSMKPMHEIQVQSAPVKNDDEDDDDVDLFGSDSEEESETAAKVREERLAAYNAKKSKKPALIAKSNIILDVKPWDDETDMKLLEAEVRKIQTEGLLWGTSKLVPLAYGINKLQISCVVEDDKVSIDWLQEQIEAIEQYVQSMDIAAFNKI